jgi:hypothetical protein
MHAQPRRAAGSNRRTPIMTTAEVQNVIEQAAGHIESAIGLRD